MVPPAELTGPKAQSGARGAAATAAHLVRRFVGSLSPRPPAPADEAWAHHWLGPGERRLWDAMSAPDRRHSVDVARRASALLIDAGGRPPGGPSERAIVAAALLHDVGKTAAGLGTFGRVAATVAGLAGARPRAASWAEGPAGARRTVGRYLLHARLGAEMLRDAGSDPATVAWAAEHHLPPSRWTVPTSVGCVLKAADDD